MKLHSWAPSRGYVDGEIYSNSLVLSCWLERCWPDWKCRSYYPQLWKKLRTKTLSSVGNNSMQIVSASQPLTIFVVQQQAQDGIFFLKSDLFRRKFLGKFCWLTCTSQDELWYNRMTVCDGPSGHRGKKTTAESDCRQTLADLYIEVLQHTIHHDRWGLLC